MPVARLREGERDMSSESCNACGEDVTNAPAAFLCDACQVAAADAVESLRRVLGFALERRASLGTRAPHAVEVWRDRCAAGALEADALRARLERAVELLKEGERDRAKVRAFLDAEVERERAEGKG